MTQPDPHPAPAPQALSDDPVESGELVQSLLHPDAYPEEERPGSVELVETHISWLFFTGRFVYKVKKPVDYGFLDFTTPARRHFYCLEELRLNRRLSPDVYLDVIPIRKRDGRYSFAGTGAVVDHAVKMRQLPRDRWLSQLLLRGEASPDLMRRIARRIAAFHAQAATDDHIQKTGGLEAVGFNTQENFQQTRDFFGVTVDPAVWDRVRAYTEAFLQVRTALFTERERQGRIRDGHGDLHADQICAEDGIAFIDCIEFNERFRFGDVAADIAFTAMDADYHGRPDLSAELVREYVAASGDGGVLDLLDFYRCYRAFTRGKVRGFRLRQAGLSSGERETVIGQASRYFALAAEYARLRGPLLVATCGLMGTGKSTLAAALAPRLGAELLSSDVLRKELAGLAPNEPRPESWGQGIYAEDFTARTYHELHRRAAERLAQPAIVILDASYREARWRRAARKTADQAGAPFLLLETICPDETVGQRLAGRSAGPSDGRLELLDTQRHRFEAPHEVPQDERLEISCAGPPNEVVQAALLQVYQRRLRG